MWLNFLSHSAESINWQHKVKKTQLHDMKHTGHRSFEILHLIRVDLISMCTSWPMHSVADLTTKVAAGARWTASPPPLLMFWNYFIRLTHLALPPNLQRESIAGYQKVLFPLCHAVSPSYYFVEREVKKEDGGGYYLLIVGLPKAL